MSDVSTWSATAASNNSSAPNGFPEGMAAGALNDACREVMAAVRRWYESAEWINLGDTPTRVDGTNFTIPSDKTTTYHVGRRIKVTGSATGYATIASSAYSVPNTNIGVTMDSGSLPLTLSTVSVGIGSATNTSIPYPTNPSWSGSATGANLTLSGTLTLTNTPLAFASGGTGANSVAGARSALGVSATGSDTTYLFRSNNLSDLTNAATARTNLGVPSTSGSGASGTWGINISGSAASASTASSATTAGSITGQGALATLNANQAETRNISGKSGTTKTLSSSAASGGSDGDIWYQL